MRPQKHDEHRAAGPHPPERGCVRRGPAAAAPNPRRRLLECEASSAVNLLRLVLGAHSRALGKILAARALPPFPLCVPSDLCGVFRKRSGCGGAEWNTAEIGRNAEREGADGGAPPSHGRRPAWRAGRSGSWVRPSWAGEFGAREWNGINRQQAGWPVGATVKPSRRARIFPGARRCARRTSRSRLTAGDGSDSSGCVRRFGAAAAGPRRTQPRSLGCGCAALWASCLCGANESARLNGCGLAVTIQ